MFIVFNYSLSLTDAEVASGLCVGRVRAPLLLLNIKRTPPLALNCFSLCCARLLPLLRAHALENTNDSSMAAYCMDGGGGLRQMQRRGKGIQLSDRWIHILQMFFFFYNAEFKKSAY